MGKIINRLIQFCMLLSMTACGFHLKNISIPVDFNQIQPPSEQNRFIALASSVGLFNQKGANITMSHLSIKPSLIAEQNTGNQWRQYLYQAQWQINDRKHHKTYVIQAEEQLNLPSNQSPYQTSLISSQLDGLRYKLLQASQLQLTKLNLESFASAPKPTT